MRISDWSSDVCSSDLRIARIEKPALARDRIVRGAAEEIGIEDLLISSGRRSAGAAGDAIDIVVEPHRPAVAPLLAEHAPVVDREARRLFGVGIASADLDRFQKADRKSTRLNSSH